MSVAVHGVAGVRCGGESKPNDTLLDGYRLATLALADMQQHRVMPTARAYELWLCYRGNGKPELTARIDTLLRAGEALTPSAIDCLREEFGIDHSMAEEEGDADALLVMSDGLRDAAQALVDHAASGRAAIRDYGEALTRGVVQLSEQPGGVESMRVISALTSDTLLAAERSRALEAQLAATSAKVDKLRKLLLDKRRAASTDQITGLANRREFDGRIRRILTKVHADPASPASLLMLDVDHFKHFNDMYGHRAGDLVLRLVGRLLTESIKGRDIAARYGGEEFAVVLLGADLNAAANVARQICFTLANKRIRLSSGTEQGCGRVTISIGVAQIRPGDTPASLVDRADSALYAAKHSGRNRVSVERELLASAG